MGVILADMRVVCLFFCQFKQEGYFRAKLGRSISCRKKGFQCSKKNHWLFSLSGVQFMDQLLHIREQTIFVQFEPPLIELTHILHLAHLLEVLLELSQLVVFSGVVGQDGDPVLELENVTVGSVVDQHHRRKVTVYDTQVLCVDVLVDLDAVLAVQSVLYVLPLGVDLVQHHVRVGLVASSKSHYLVYFAHSLQKSNGVWPDCYIGVGCGPVLDLNRQLQVITASGFLLAMQQCLVDIDQQRFFSNVSFVAGEDDSPLFEFRVGGRLYLKVVFEDLQGDIQVIEGPFVPAVEGLGQVAEIVPFQLDLMKSKSGGSQFAGTAGLSGQILHFDRGFAVPPILILIFFIALLPYDICEGVQFLLGLIDLLLQL